MTGDAALLRALRSAEMHVLVGELAAQLSLARAEVDAGLKRLSAAGFDVEVHPQFGCRLRGSPDRILADDLWARMGGCGLAREILVFEETGSTNDVASKLGREGHPGRVVIFAERQTVGRGRFGRKWDSAERAGLWFSILLRPAWPMVRWPRLTTWAGVSVAMAVENATGVKTQIKWPNDVLAAGRKVAGILIESAADAKGAPFAVVGVGINVNQTEFPPEIAASAGSLRQICGRTQERAALAAALLETLDRMLPMAAENDDLIRQAGSRSAVLGKWIKVRAGNYLIEGTAEELDGDGNLLIRLGDGTLHRATAGEVTTQMPG